MTGLREWRRDRELPARAGEPELVPPSETELLALVGEHLLRAGTAAPQAARWVYARWKPGASSCSAYAVDFGDDDEEQLVVAKLYLGDKASALAARPDVSARGDEQGPLLDSAVLPERRLHLWREGHDRELPGLLRLADMRRTKRLLAEQGVFLPRRLRSHRSQLTRLRYRPERRAVLRLDACLRDEQGTRSAARLAVRALPPEVAAAVAEQRRLHGSRDWMPRLQAVEERSGLLFEEWLDVQSCSDQDFGRVQEAATVLAALHRPLSGGRGRRAAEPAADEPLFAWNAELRGLLGESVAPPASATPCWTHGDFHPDQLAFERQDGALRLLDLDGLAAGDHHDDLASWIADEWLADPQQDPRRAGEGLLGAYAAAGGRVVDPERLQRGVVAALKCRAAASLRRLEQDAEQVAGRILATAGRLVGRWAGSL